MNCLTISILHYLCSIFLAGHWKILGRGGAVKTRKHPCYCCAVTTEELAKPSHNIDECNWCRDYILKNKISPEMVTSGEWVCFHRPIITDELKSSLYEQLKESQIIWKDGVNIELDVVRQNSQLNAPHDFERPTLPERNDSSMICFDLEGKADPVKASFLVSIIHDLQQRNQFKTVDESLSLSQLQVKLGTLMRYEARMVSIQKDVEYGELSSSNAAYVVLNAVPCTLHCGQRMAIKFVNLLLSAGLSRAQRDAPVRGLQAAVDSFFRQVEDLFTTTIFGSPHNPKFWKVPYDHAKKKLGDVKFDGDQCQRVMNNIALIIDVCLHSQRDSRAGDEDDISLEDERQLWNVAMEYYKEGKALLDLKRDLTMDEIYDFQFAIDNFALNFIFKLGLGQEGITNYGHLYFSGHMGEYLIEHKSLHAFSQQGFEHMNGFLKRFIHRRTNKGGGKGSNSRLLPLARMLSRKFAYMSGASFEQMKAYVLGSPVSEHEPEYDDFTAANGDLQNLDESDEIENPTSHIDISTVNWGIEGVSQSL